VARDRTTFGPREWNGFARWAAKGPGWVMYSACGVLVALLWSLKLLAVFGASSLRAAEQVLRER